MTTCNKIYFKLKTVLKILSACYKYNTVSTLSEMVSAVMELVMLWPDLTNVFRVWSAISTARLKGHSQLWDRADLDTSFSHFEKSPPQPEIQKFI